MAEQRQAMTAFAQAALAVSDLVEAKFRDFRFSGSVPRMVKVQAPIVESTGGGKQARESIVLVPTDGSEDGVSFVTTGAGTAKENASSSGSAAHAAREAGASASVTCGFIDVGLRAVELRSYSALAVIFEQRAKKHLDIPRGEYENFTRQLQEFLSGEGYVFRLVGEHEQALKAKDEKVAATSMPQTTLLYAVVGVLSIVVLVLLAMLAIK